MVASPTDEHLSNIEEVGLVNLPSEWETTTAALRAILRYVNEQDMAQASDAFADYFKVVAGIPPGLIPTPVLERDKRIFRQLLQNMSPASFTRTDDNSLREYYEEYKERRGLGSFDDIRGHLSWHAARELGFLSKATGYSFLEMEYEVEPIVEDAPWTCWERLGPDGKKLLNINWHPRQQRMWSIGAAEYYAKHEIVGHFGMAHIQSHMIREGLIDDIAGYMLIPEPRCWILEGVAQTIDQFVDLHVSDEGKLFDSAYRLFARARSNALHRIQIDGISEEQAALEIKPYIFIKPDEDALRDLRNGARNKFWSPYLPVYGLSDYRLMEVAKTTNKERRLRLLRIMFEKPLTPTQLDELISTQ